jgi:hypothetical protein
MNDEARKCVMVIAEGLPLGLVANTAAVLAVTLGRTLDGIVGPAVVDASGQTHTGIVNITLPILTAASTAIGRIRAQAVALNDIFVVDVTDVAQRTRTYADFTEQIGATPAEALVYLGIALYGPRKSIAKLTGNLPLLRDPQPAPAEHPDGSAH